MKKYIYLIVLALILGLVLTGCSLLSNIGQAPATDQSGIAYLKKGAGDEGSAEEFPLFAGQNIDVGIVKVWNDSDNLYVKYIVDEPWCLAETHLHVADSVEAIPQKNGNPIPGKFDYKMEHSCVPDYTYTIVKSLIPSDLLYIAAHAVVKKVETVSECLVSGAGSDNVLYLEEDPLNPGYPVDYTADYQTYSGTPSASVLAWEHSSWVDVPGAQWIGSAYETENTNYNTWRLFTRSFTLPDNAVNISGSLTMNCDNAEEAYLNSYFVGDGSPAIVYGPSIINVSPPPGVEHGWSSLEGPWDVSSLLTTGSNELWTMTRNYAWSGGPEANPSGLSYKLCYQYDLVTEETAWGAEDEGLQPFSGANWATYFTYTHDGCYILDITAVNGNSGYTHYFTISYDPDTELFTGTGTGAGGVETLSNIELVEDVISFTSVYANNYTWYPEFELNGDGSLTFIDGHGPDNVYSATGTWEITYDCNGD